MPTAKPAALVLGAVLAISCRTGIQGRADKVQVVVLGFDGANWETIDPLIEAGKLPLLAKLKQEAAWAPLRTFKPTKSPVIWTSIATGKSMEKHGILDFVFMEQNEIQVPYSNSERREPSIWQILDHAELRSVIVNWFVTYPPDAIDGVMVSNRFRKTLLLKQDQRPRMADSVHPPQYFRELKPFLSLDYEDVRAQRELPDLPGLHESLRPSNNAEDIQVLKDYRIYVLQEALNENVAKHLYESEDFDFFAAYFRLPDIVQHTALSLLDPDQVEKTLAAMRKGELTSDDRALFEESLAAVLEPFYCYMERLIESYLNAMPENAYLIVVSDHGFSLHRGGYDHYHIPESFPAPSGIFLMKGPGTKPGLVPSVSVYDIAPTILHLFDLPIGEDMDGSAVTTALTWERDTGKKRYARELMEPKEHRRDAEIDARTLEELRSLGYIK